MVKRRTRPSLRRGPGGELARSTSWLQVVLKSLLPSHLDGRLLDIGSAEGHIARLWASKEGQATYCHYQLSVCRQAATTSGMRLQQPLDQGLPGSNCWLWAVDPGGLQIVFTDLVPAGPYAVAAFDTRDYETAYALEMVEHIAAELDDDGWLLSVIDGGSISPTRWEDKLRIWFGDVRVLDLPSPKARGLVFFLSRRPVRGKMSSVEYYPWQVTFRGRVYEFWGAPGVFSPKSLDPGTAFMLEHIEILPGERLLDLGCGTGVVAVLTNKEFGIPALAIDSSARALRLAAMNREHNLAEGVEIYPSDGWADVEAAAVFDVIACNPPYHTDFSVARRFIEGAFEHLREGGRLYLVVKRVDWYANRLRSLFGGCQVFTNDEGYAVLVSQRRQQGLRKKEKPAKVGTRKHQKRLERARQRKHLRK